MSSTCFVLADGSRAFEIITMERFGDQAGEFGRDSDFLGSEFLFKKRLIRQHVNNDEQEQQHQQHSHHHANSPRNCPRFEVLREQSYVVDAPRNSKKSRGSLFGQNGSSVPDVALRVLRDPLVRRKTSRPFQGNKIRSIF